jgi:polar amino acid transport system substrate-binding protein
MLRSRGFLADAILGGVFLFAWGLLGIAPISRAHAADAAKCEPEKLAAKYPSLAHQKIRAGEDGESPPYSMRDPGNFDRIIGVDGDLIRAVFKCVGTDVEFKMGAWSGLLPAVIAGQTDAMWYLYYTAERAKQVDFVVFLKAGTGALVKKGNPKGIKSMDDTCGTTATAGLGTVEEAAFREQSTKCPAAGKALINIMTYPDIPSGTRLIQNDRADIMMSDLALVDKLAFDNPQVFERGFKIISDFKIGVAVKKGNDDLLNAIYDAMRVLQDDGTEKQILESYNIDPSLILPVTVLRE